MKHDTSEFATMGIAALLPGMRYMIELMQRAVSDKQDLLSLLQQDGVGVNRKPGSLPGVGPVKRGRGRPPGSGTKPKLINGWPADPAERSREMKRRQAVTRSNGAKSAWTGMTAEQRSVEMKRRVAVARAKRSNTEQRKELARLQKNARNAKYRERHRARKTEMQRVRRKAQAAEAAVEKNT